MRLLLVLLVALAMGLNGVARVAVMPMDAPMDAPVDVPGTHADAGMNHDCADSPPCDCCGDGLPAGADCQATCVTSPGLAVPTLDLGAPIVLAVVHDRPSAQRPDSRAPSPLRRPPRLAS